LLPFLTGVIITGIPISISSSNSGSAWDNSKKMLESNLFVNYFFVEDIDKFLVDKKNIELKRKQSLNNAIIGDNIGDAFKDIAGPSVTILIKFIAFLCLIIFRENIMSIN